MLADKIRKNALKRATSPEQLDALLTVTPPYGWLAALVLTCAVAAFMLWSILATAPIKVAGNGILLIDGEILSARTSGNGWVSEINTKVGDKVQKGAILARLRNLDTEAKIEEAEAKHRRILSTLHQTKQANDTYVQSLDAEFSSSEVYFKKQVADLDSQVQRLQKQLKERKALYTKGLTTEPTVLTSQSALEAAQEALIAARYDFSAKRAQYLTSRHASEREIIKQTAQAAEALEAVTALKKAYERASVVRAGQTGIITESTARIGTTVAPNDLLFELMPTEQVRHEDLSLLGVIYVDASKASRVKPGASVEIIPSSVALERDGYIIATVDSISPLPATRAQLLIRLGNEDLVSSLTRKGPVSEVLVRLETDPKTPSGLAWSTRTGPGFSIQPGTITEASFIVDRKRIASFLFPRLEEILPAARGELERGGTRQVLLSSLRDEG